MNSGGSLKPFTCYFCSNVITNETEQGHRSTCGSLLEPCPYKCGAYTQRKLKNRHLMECPNKTNAFKNSADVKKNYRFSMDAEQVSPTSPLPPQNSFAQEELLLLRGKLQKLEQLCTRLTQNFSFFKEKNDKSVHDQETQLIHQRLELEKMQYQNLTLLEWKKLVEAKLDLLSKSSLSIETIKNEIDIQTQNLKSKIANAETLRIEFEQLKNVFDKSKEENGHEINTKFSEIRDIFLQENATTAALWNDHKNAISFLDEKSANLQTTLEEQQTKIASLTFDMRTIMNIASETSEKTEIQEKLLKELQLELRQIKFDLEVLEEGKAINSAIQPGCLLWKISNFTNKLESSKTNEAVLKSPIFYTDYYGYKIRIIVYLNGIKKWKGRHLIAGIHVLNGEYDALLQWPCNIEAKVTLKDLENINNPKDYSKFINAKRSEGGEENEDPQESSSQYIFIPHSTITKPTYLKDNTVFLEIKIRHINRRKEETNL